MKNRVVFIYALTDPAGNIRYVGQSVNPQIRYEQHIADSADTPKTKWIRELSRMGAKPELVILEKTDKINADYTEKWWMALGRKRGWQLSNVKTAPGRNPNFAELFTEQLREDFEQFVIEHDPVIFITRQHVKVIAFWLRVVIGIIVGAFIGWSAYSLEMRTGSTDMGAVYYGLTMFLSLSHLNFLWATGMFKDANSKSVVAWHCLPSTIFLVDKIQWLFGR